LDDIAPGYVAIARVLGAWGPRGALKVEALAPKEAFSPGRVVQVAGIEHEIHEVGRSGRFLRITLSGIERREKAAALRDQTLQVREADLESLPEGQYYRFQLLGLRVIGAGGEDLGQVTDVMSAPENDIYVVTREQGEVLIPAVDDVVQSIDLSLGEMRIEIVPGLLP
jgi:16S rRNA processing protein RimM